MVVRLESGVKDFWVIGRTGWVKAEPSGQRKQKPMDKVLTVEEVEARGKKVRTKDEQIGYLRSILSFVASGRFPHLYSAIAKEALNATNQDQSEVRL